jgi:hypothetical protein
MDMPPNDIEKFNPNEFTEQELVKLIYRDLLRLRKDFDEFVKNDSTHKEISDLKVRVTTLETELKLQKELKEASEKSTKRMLGWAAFLLAILQAAIAFILRK